MVLPGMAERMTASPKSLSRSQARSGTVRASSGLGIRKIDQPLGLGHEESFGQSGPLRDLHPGFDRPRAGSGVQLARCPVRRGLGLYKKSGPCRLDYDPVAL